MKRTITFTVNIEQQCEDGCGNTVKTISEGEVRDALNRGLAERNVQSVNVTVEPAEASC